MRIRTLLLNNFATTLHSVLFGQPSGANIGEITVPAPILPQMQWYPYRARSGGSLAHRKWRKRRSSGRR